MRKFIITIALCTLSASALAQDPDGSGEAPSATAAQVTTTPLSVYDVTFHDTEVYVGQPVVAYLRLQDAEHVELTSVQITDTPHVEVLDYALGPDDEDGVTELMVTLTAFRPGEHIISGLEVHAIGPDGAPQEASAPTFTLPVLATLEADDDTLTPPGPFEPVYTRNMTVLYGGILLGAGFMLGLIALLWRRRQLANAPIMVDVPPPRPADEVALEALDVLEHSGWLESGRHIDYHLRLSEILREFIGTSFAFHATEMTTEEVMAAIDRIPEDTAQFRDTIRDHLNQMDMVKFAKASLPLDASREMLAATIDLVVAVTEQRRAHQLELAAQAALPGVDDEADTAPETGADR